MLCLDCGKRFAPVAISKFHFNNDKKLEPNNEDAKEEFERMFDSDEKIYCKTCSY